MAQAGGNPTLWERTKGYSSTAYEKALKPGFNKAYKVVDKLGAPVNRLSNRVGSEAFWPTSLDKESEKCARILRGFCKDGFYEQIEKNQAERVRSRESTGAGVPQGKQRVLKKIPAKVIKEAKGLAIFTTMRTGWLLGGSGGSGVLVGRHPETGEWSPPSGIQTQNLAFGFLAGVDIYDTVLVINTYTALEAFTKLRCTLGTEVAVAAGPVGIGGAMDTEVHKRQAPIWSYVKSRGLYAGIALEGNLVIERTDENARFYGEQVPVADILVGKVRHPPQEQYKILMDTLKAAQGEIIDEDLLPEAGLLPSDMELLQDGSFGIPAEDDPDPYGVKALEAEGLHIREAGTHQRPSPEVFEFRPAPTSPIYSHFARKSVDGSIRSRTWRESTQSMASIDRGTQTDDEDGKSASQSPRRDSSRDINPQREPVFDEGHQVSSPREQGESFSDVDSDAEIHTAVPMVARARMVSVPKRLPPALPPRHPGRAATPTTETDTPVDGFDRISLNGTSTNKSEEHTTTSDSTETVPTELRDTTELSKTTSAAHGPDDHFQSIPPTPTEGDSKKLENDIPGSFQA